MASGDLVYRAYLAKQVLTAGQRSQLATLLSTLFEGPLSRVDSVAFERDGTDVVCTMAVRRSASAASLPLGVEVMEREP